MPNKPILSKRVLEQHTLSHYERERRTRHYVVIGSIVVAFIVLALIGAFVYQQLIYEPNRPVAVVGGDPITASQVQAREKLEFSNLQYSYSQVTSQIQQLQQQSASGTDYSFLIQYYQQQLQQIASQSSSDSIARNALQSLVDDKLIRQETARRGITVSQQEVRQDFEQSVGYYSPTLTPFPTYTPVPPTLVVTATATSAPTATPVSTTQSLTPTQPLTPTATTGPEPTATPRLQPTSITQAELEQSQQNGEKYYQSLGYPADTLMHAYETGLLTKKLQDAIATQTPTMTQHYKFDYVRFNEVATATQYLQLLAARQITFEQMITLANSITQPVPIGLGAHDDWTSKDAVTSRYGDEVLAQLESAPLNQPTGVITSQLTGGFFILLPLGREVRPLNESDLSQAQSQAYTDWLTAARADANKVQNLIDPLTVMPSALKSSITEFQQAVAQSSGVQ